MKIKWQENTEKNMQIRTKNEVTYLGYPKLEKTDGIIHGFSTRLGGVSEEVRLRILQVRSGL